MLVLYKTLEAIVSFTDTSMTGDHGHKESPPPLKKVPYLKETASETASSVQDFPEESRVKDDERKCSKA